MAPVLHPGALATILVVGIPTSLYVLFLGLGCIPFFQRHFLYAHKVSSRWFTDLNKPERWGFARNQVTPFGLVTPDEETLYAWHIMPLPLYLKHETSVATQDLGYCKDFTATESFRLLKEDPKSRVVLYFHGNAGHTAQGFRPTSYHSLTDTSSYHVIAVDYRGFGHSTGAPTEEGLIADATAVVDWTIEVAGVSSNRITLLGHSLGTAVVAAVAERYIHKDIEFAGIVLVAAFSDLPTMLGEYRIGGILPVLAPFRAWPALFKAFRSVIVDKWRSDERLTSLVRSTKNRLRLNLVHAKNDGDIPCTEDNKLFKAAVQGLLTIDDGDFTAWKKERTIEKGQGASVTTWNANPNIIVRQELFPHGGHNNIMNFAPVALAVMRSFDFEGTSYAQ